MRTNTIMACLSALVFTFLCGSLAAQESFDLSTQRSENQNILRVSGQKKDHGEWPINPVPHNATFSQSERLSIANGLAVKDIQKTFSEDMGFMEINAKGTPLSIDYGEKVSLKQGVKQVSGAYSLCIDKKGISITGFDERGAYYGLQTLRQMLASPSAQDKYLPYAEILDYPDIALRGVVEAFYGTPWPHEVRLSLIDFYGRFKMNTYFYGPKDDPYHSCPNWRLPYPEKEANNIRELIDACRRNRVDFVWAIHPGQDIKWNEEDYQNLKNKFNLMYDLGVRSFAIFFDDISGEGTNPLKQTELLNRLTEDFVKAKGDVNPLTVCPTDYSRLWADPTPEGSLAVYGKTLDPAINVFWTGDVVCSDLTKETLDFVNSRIQRPALYWWNYPVTDYARNYLLQGPVYGLETTLAENDICGLLSNPMEHGEASKLALYGVADYTWNCTEYDPIDNWERGMEELMPQAKEAYRRFAIHSCDTESGYRRDESWETETFRLEDWDDEKASALEKEFAEIEKVSSLLEQGCDNQLLLNELRPWLVEFSKLGTRGRRTIEVARLYRSGQDNALFWKKYAENIMSAEQQKSYDEHKSGTMKLQPFYENMMDDMAHGFLKDLLHTTPKDYKGISSFNNSGTSISKLMLDNDTTSFYTSAESQTENSWIGVDLRAVREVAEVSVKQGRNSVDDGDYFDHAVLECSKDGMSWTPLIDDLKRQYIINWKGNPVMARYVRLRRLESARNSFATVRSFEVNPARVENLGFGICAENADKAIYMFDQNPSTSYTLNCGESLLLEVPAGTKAYTILMKEPAEPLVCKFYDSGNGIIAEKVLTAPYSTIEVPDAEAATIAIEAPGDNGAIEGVAEIYEIVID